MKYKLTDETMMFNGAELHRIECVTPFNDVKSGEKGGWIEKEENLSQEGNAWVGGNAKVCEDAQVKDNALVLDNAYLYGYAYVCDNAKVSDNAQVCEGAFVCNYAQVGGNALVHGNTEVFDNARVFDNAVVGGKALAYGDAIVCSDACVIGDARIKSSSDYMIIRNIWTSNRIFTWTKSNNKWNVGCFYGTGKELIKKAYHDSEISGKCYEMAVKFVEGVNSIKNEN